MKQKDAIGEYHLNKDRPDKPQFAIHDLKAYLTINQGKANKPHIHSFYQIIWFKKGAGKHFVDFKQYDVFENAIFFIGKNQVHYFDENMDYDGILIHFSELFLGPNESSIDYLMKYSLFNNPYQMASCCIGQGIENTLSGYIDQIYAELATEEDFARDELLRTYLKAFLIQVQRRKNDFEQANGKMPFMPDEKREQLIRFVNLVDGNFNKGFAVAEYAQLLHISPRTLSDLTAQTLNKTPLTVIQERIILEAQRLLLHSGLNVNQIGYRLWFDDPSYFVKYFKKHTKISPSEFRRSIS